MLQVRNARVLLLVLLLVFPLPLVHVYRNNRYLAASTVGCGARWRPSYSATMRPDGASLSQPVSWHERAASAASKSDSRERASLAVSMPLSQPCQPNQQHTVIAIHYHVNVTKWLPPAGAQAPSSWSRRPLALHPLANVQTLKIGTTRITTTVMLRSHKYTARLAPVLRLPLPLHMSASHLRRPRRPSRTLRLRP